MRRTLRHGYHAYVPKGALLKTDMLASSPQLVTAVFRETEAAAERADRASDDAGFFSRPRLNYPVASGIPAFISRRQFDVQYNIFHHDAVETLNRHTLGTSLEGHSLETVIRRTSFDATQAAAHTAAAEHFNYCFFYKSLRPWGTAVPKQLREAFQLQYGRDGSVDVVEEVKRLLTVVVLSHQERCGWVYLVWTGKQFDVVEFPHGACPIGSDLIPLLAINVHEGAYSLDYGLSGLEQYAQNYFRACNWFLAERITCRRRGGGRVAMHERVWLRGGHTANSFRFFVVLHAFSTLDFSRVRVTTRERGLGGVCWCGCRLGSLCCACLFPSLIVVEFTFPFFLSCALFSPFLCARTHIFLLLCMAF
ncbi:hypothetical protein TcYC6_0097980 [Trypanosoma cruzi]|nr:hypothetical protein TcYC6_0097980 [Trypanosoma cruzi]